MERRKWKPEEKLTIMLEGLKNETSIAELCRRHQISQTQFYKWRDQFLQGASFYYKNKPRLKKNNGSDRD